MHEERDGGMHGERKESKHEGHRERLRDKMVSHGEALTDIQVLELVLFRSISRKDTNPVAHDLLDSFCDLPGVFSATPRLLCTVAGVGPRTAADIYLEGLLQRRLRSARINRKRLYNYAEVSEYVRGRFEGATAEKLEVYLTDKDGLLLCIKSVSAARKDSVSIDSQSLSYMLSEVKPHGIIVAHNHPSGVAEPSGGDDAALLEMAQACRLQGVRLSDSVIYARGELFSYYHSGRLAQLLPEKK